MQMRPYLSNFAMRAGVAAAAVTLVAPSTAAAHGLQTRADLPIPITAFYIAAVVVLVVSFVLLSALWSTPRLTEYRWRQAPEWLTGLVLSRVTTAAGRVIVLATFLLVLAATLFGERDARVNIAPTIVYVTWAVGLVPLAVFFGNVWRQLNPWATIARLLRLPADRGTYPERLGVWPAVPILLAFSWTELVYPTPQHLRLMACLIIIYSIYTLGGMGRYGVEAWLDRGEAFAVYSRLLARLSIVETRSIKGRLVLGFRRPVVGIVRTVPKPGLVVFVTLMIGTVSFDGLSRTSWYTGMSSDLVQRLISAGSGPVLARTLVGTLFLLVVAAIATGAFELATWTADRIGGLKDQLSQGRVADAFVHSLIPIAFAYAVAHYFSYFIMQSQDLIRLASDPFGSGADLFGTRDFRINYNQLSPTLIWYVQVGVIVTGHVLGLIFAHDRALELTKYAKQAARSQYAMLALMLLYTVGGLYFLSEGMTG